MRSVLPLFLILFFCGWLSAADRPNILFLFADDQRADTIAAHGNPHIKTPHLDSLSGDGYSFLRNYCAGSFSGAVCVASRAMLMTGQHWMSLPRDKPQHNWGESVVTLPKHLQEAGGYQTHIIGKWHNGLNTLRQSFSDGQALYMGGMADHSDFQVQDYTGGTLSDKRDAGGFSSTVFADAAIDYLAGQKDSEAPFFLYVSFLAPHDPRNPPEEYREMYYQDRPPLPSNYAAQHPFQNAPQATMGRDESLAPWPRTKEMISDQLCEYYGLVTHLDEQVGRILQALDEAGLAEDTIVVYTADHGLGMGSHGLLGKQNVYEQSMRCPLILRGPGVPEAASTTAYSYIHDLYATLCDLTAIDTPEDIDSQSLKPLMTGETEAIHPALFLPFQDNQRAVSDGRWKLYRYPLINHQLLFDLQADPHELVNRADDPAYAEELSRMYGLMDAYRLKQGDPYPIAVDEPAPHQPQYDNANRTLDKWQPKWIREKYFDGREDPNHGVKKK